MTLKEAIEQLRNFADEDGRPRITGSDREAIYMVLNALSVPTMPADRHPTEPAPPPSHDMSHLAAYSSAIFPVEPHR